jgi:hypothetical protein
LAHHDEPARGAERHEHAHDGGAAGLFSGFYVEPDRAACLVLTGEGSRGFCTGADLKERKGMSDEVWRRQHAIVEQMIRAIMDCPVPSSPRSTAPPTRAA